MSVVFRHELLVTNVAYSTSSREYSPNDSPLIDQSKVYCSLAYATDKCLGSEDFTVLLVGGCDTPGHNNLFRMSFIGKEIMEARVNYNSLTK